MAIQKKRINPIHIIIIMLCIVILILLILLLKPNEIKPTFLDVTGPDVIFVGEENNLKINSSNNVDLIMKYGYIKSDKIHYDEGNINAILSAIRSGDEEITIKTNDLEKRINILVCDKVNIIDSYFEIDLDETKTIEFNIDQKCLSQYNISIENQEIADYQNGIIYTKKAGTTSLIISRENETNKYTIDVKEKKLEFNSNKTEFNIGEKINIPLINLSKNHTCSSNNDLVSIKESDDGCFIEMLKEGTTTIKAIDNNRTAELTIKIINPIIDIENISINPSAIRVIKGNSVSLNPQIIPSNATNKTIVYNSLNPNIATISNGIVNAVNYGTTIIEATTNNGKKANVSIIVTGENILDFYESTTLKYWIEKRGNNYAITNIWVNDSYSQFKMAITAPKNSNSLTPRIPQDAKTIITNTINEKNYQNKGLIAINASAMVSKDYGKGTPSSWYGTSQIPLIIHDGKIIRDSSSEAIKTDDDYIIYGLKKNGELTYYNYTNGRTNEQKEENKKIVNNIINDGVLYTFGFKPVLLSNGNIMNMDDSRTHNIRQAICQVNNNNFIIITNTNSTNNRKDGFSFTELAELFKSLNCKTALNLDGGGSTCEYYKNNTNDLKRIKTTYSSRQLSDMIYFVEK